MLTLLLVPASDLVDVGALCQIVDPRGRKIGDWGVAPVPAQVPKVRAPMRVQSVGMDPNGDLLDKIEVRNESDKIVVSYRLGWNIRRRIQKPGGQIRAEDPALEAFVGDPVTTVLKPKGKERAPRQGVSSEALGKSMKEKSLKGLFFIVVGVAEVEFQDGSRWSADPASFLPKVD